MAARKEPVFLGIDHVDALETDHESEFGEIVEFALLVALKELCKLNDLEFQQADKLLKQHNGR